jgi:hypothetical protein
MESLIQLPDRRVAGTPCGHPSCKAVLSDANRIHGVPEDPPDEVPGARATTGTRCHARVWARASASEPNSCAPAMDDEQERRSRLVLPHEGSSLGASLPGAPAGASPNAAAARRLLKPLLWAFYPSLPEPRRRIDLALWAVVVQVGITIQDHRCWRADLLTGGRVISAAGGLTRRLRRQTKNRWPDFGYAARDARDRRVFPDPPTACLRMKRTSLCSGAMLPVEELRHSTAGRTSRQASIRFSDPGRAASWGSEFR